jgi:mannosyl-oligosaccharide alpha-1,2-mannosidase
VWVDAGDNVVGPGATIGEVLMRTEPATPAQRLMPRRRFLQLLGGTAAAAALRAELPAPAGAATPPNTAYAAWGADVRQELRRSWQFYVDFAFGHDQIRPVSGGFTEFFVPGHPVGLTIVEALDTLYVMGLDDELAQGVQWIEQNLSDFDIDASFQVFETNIRMVGGLLSGYHATRNQRLLDLAHELADRLLPAFTSSPTGIPYRFVNLRTGAVTGNVTFPAEIGTYIAEFGDLSGLVGDPKYYDIAKAAMNATYDRRSDIGLLADNIDVETGKWTSRRATIGPPSDSFYEYLFDGFDLFGDHDLKTWYDVLTAAILEHQTDTSTGHLWFQNVDFRNGRPLDTRQSELASFYAGLLGQSGHPTEARAYHDSWKLVHDRYPLLPEGIDYTTLAATSRGNQLRPEYVDSAFILWLTDGNDLWRQRGLEHYQHMKQYNRVRYGYTIATDVTTTPPALGDFCPGYWWSEQMKYYFLLFANSDRFDYAHNYLSTEGNVLRGLL